MHYKHTHTRALRTMFLNGIEIINNIFQAYANHADVLKKARYKQYYPFTLHSLLQHRQPEYGFPFYLHFTFHLLLLLM